MGLVLARDGEVVAVAGIAAKDGRPTVAGVLPGDRFISIDGRAVAGLTRGQLIAALHGRPGDAFNLVVDRKRRRFDIRATVTAF